jgi:hypothetical protein
MARLECTVAHMGFPAATLNKRIKKKSIHTVTILRTKHTGSLNFLLELYLGHANQNILTVLTETHFVFLYRYD